MSNDRSWMAALTGLGFLVVALAGFIVAGEPPDAGSDSQEEIVAFYVDNEDAQNFGAALVAIAAALLIFFGAYLRRFLSAGEGERSLLPAVAFAGTIVIATGLAIDGTLSFALADTAGEIDPASTEALLALWNNDFLPLAMGVQVFLFALGISSLRHNSLPRAVGAIAILFAVLAVTPIGFVSFLGFGLLVAALSVMLAMRARSAPATT